jgi:hypothetical protein
MRTSTPIPDVKITGKYRKIHLSELGEDNVFDQKITATCSTHVVGCP